MVERDITNCIRRLRFEADEMTQKELARRVGVTRQTIIAIEAEKYAPSLKLAFRIARAFDLGVEDVFQFGSDETTGRAQAEPTNGPEGP